MPAMTVWEFPRLLLLVEVKMGTKNANEINSEGLTSIIIYSIFISGGDI